MTRGSLLARWQDKSGTINLQEFREARCVVTCVFGTEPGVSCQCQQPAEWRQTVGLLTCQQFLVLSFWQFMRRFSTFSIAWLRIVEYMSTFTWFWYVVWSLIHPPGLAQKISFKSSTWETLQGAQTGPVWEQETTQGSTTTLEP